VGRPVAADQAEIGLGHAGESVGCIEHGSDQGIVTTGRSLVQDRLAKGLWQREQALPDLPSAHRGNT
jgi:hypothetical protein